MAKRMNENQPKKDKGSRRNLSRRRFLKDVGMMAGGVAITSMFVSSACSSGDATPNTTATTSKTTTGTTTPTIQPTSTPITTSQSATTKPNATTTATWNGIYKPSLVDRPEMGKIIGCEAEAAMDRLYAREHMWVKIITDNVVAIGITDRFLFYFEGVINIELQDVGTDIQRGMELATIEGKKMTVDAVSPVSGTILQNNQDLFTDLDSTINRYPYITGWMHVVQLSQPQELDELMSPEEYIDYISSHLDA